MANLVFMQRNWSDTYLLMNYKYLSFIWRPPTSLSTYFHLIFPMLMCSLTKMHTQKCGNFENTRIITSSHVQCACVKTCLRHLNVSKWHFECDPHSSADLTQRSRLFLCVETNRWCMLSSSIASAVCWVNSAQFFSGKSMSMKQHYFNCSGTNPHHLHLPIVHMPWEDIWYPKLLEDKLSEKWFQQLPWPSPTYLHSLHQSSWQIRWLFDHQIWWK